MSAFWLDTPGKLTNKLDRPELVAVQGRLSMKTGNSSTANCCTQEIINSEQWRGLQTPNRLKRLITAYLVHSWTAQMLEGFSCSQQYLCLCNESIQIKFPLWSVCLLNCFPTVQHLLDYNRMQNSSPIYHTENYSSGNTILSPCQWCMKGQKVKDSMLICLDTGRLNDSSLIEHLKCPQKITESISAILS